jgi:hypothetical protein
MIARGQSSRDARSLPASDHNQELQILGPPWMILREGPGHLFSGDLRGTMNKKAF